MLRFIRPALVHIPALADYRREVLASDGDFDGTAGLGNFREPADWLARAALLDSPEAARRGWFPTKILLGMGEDRICGIVNARLTGDASLTESAGNIGYHVRPSERGRGYGRELLLAGVSLCRANGIPAPSLLILQEHTPSVRPALSAGFREAGLTALPDGRAAKRFLWAQN